MNSLVVSPKCTIPEHICCCSKLGDWTYFWVRNSFWDKTSNNWVRLDKKVRKNIPIKIDYFDSKVKKYILIKKSCSEGWICVGGGGVCIRVSFFLSLEQASYYFHQIVSKFSFCCRRLSFCNSLTMSNVDAPGDLAEKINLWNEYLPKFWRDRKLWHFLAMYLQDNELGFTSFIAYILG